MNDSNFIVKPSTISIAGKGLFTNVDIPRDSVVIEYYGKRQLYHSHKKHDYCYGIGNNICINAFKSKSLARYVNDNYNYSEKKLNLKWKVINDKVFMESICDIPKNTELFISYGNIYWK